LGLPFDGRQFPKTLSNGLRRLRRIEDELLVVAAYRDVGVASFLPSDGLSNVFGVFDVDSNHPRREFVIDRGLLPTGGIQDAEGLGVRRDFFRGIPALGVTIFDIAFLRIATVFARHRFQHLSDTAFDLIVLVEYSDKTVVPLGIVDHRVGREVRRRVNALVGKEFLYTGLDKSLATR